MAETADVLFRELMDGAQFSADTFRLQQLEFEQLAHLRRLCRDEMLAMKDIKDDATEAKRSRLGGCLGAVWTRLNAEAPVRLPHALAELGGAIDAASARSTRIGHIVIGLTVVIAVAAIVGAVDIALRLCG